MEKKCLDGVRGRSDTHQQMDNNPACVMCRWWTGEATSPTGECRRFGPQLPRVPRDDNRVHAEPRPWPTTGADDWCYFHAPRGGIPGGRGPRLTNVEICAAVAEAGGMSPIELREKLIISGLSEQLAERRLENLIGRGTLVARADGLLEPAERAEKSAGNDAETAPAGEKASPRGTLGLEMFCGIVQRIAPDPVTALGFNDLFREVAATVLVGKSTFQRLLRAAVQAGRIHHLIGGTAAGRYCAARNKPEIETP